MFNTTITNSQGIANYSFNSQGYGDTIISASINELEDNISIEDYIAHYFRGNEQWEDYGRNGAFNFRYTPSDYEFIWTTVTGAGKKCAKTFQSNEDVSISFDLKSNNPSGDYGRISIHKYGNNQAERSCIGFRVSGGGLSSISVSKTDSNSLSEIKNIDVSDYRNIRIDTSKSNNSANLYVDGEFSYTFTGLAWLNDVLTIYTQSWGSNGVVYMKNMKIKKLSS